MLTIHDLLEDSRYKEFFCKVPNLPDHLTSPGRKPWRLYVLLKGESDWRTKDCATYAEAFKRLKKLLPRAADATINCPGFSFDPPVRIVRIKGKYKINSRGEKQQVTKMVTWKPRIPPDEYEEHEWCPYCRRPTVFKRYFKHHALKPRKVGGLPIDPAVLRCAICGASERIVTLRRS